MRKLMAAVMVVSGLGLVTGCERKGEIQQQRENVAEAQRDVAQEHQEMNQDVAEARQGTAKDVAEARQDSAKDVAEAHEDLADEQNKLAEKQYEQLTDSQATGGSGMASDKLEEVKGTIQSASGNKLTLIVPNQDNKLLSFKSDSQVKVMRDDKAMSMSSLKAGDEVRASYQMDPKGQMLLRSVELTEKSAQHKSGMMK